MLATPIGNLEDITLRALRILGEVDIVFCEDTRVTRKLLNKYDLHANLQSMNACSEEGKIDHIMDLLADGKKIAYVSDAGTPCISDPGVKLVSAVRMFNKSAGHEKQIKIAGIPGASALATALSVAGIPTNKFLFFGFLPKKKGRVTMIKEICESKYTVVFYESSHRILKLMYQLKAYASHKKITVARELTKVYEEVLQGSADDILAEFENNPQKQKGEFVVMVSE